MALSKRDQALLGVLAGMGFVALAYFGYNSYSTKRAALRAERDKLAQELQVVKDKVRNIEAVEERLKEAAKLQADLERSVPKEEEIPQLLRDITDMLTTSGVVMASFRPSRPKPSILPELNEINVSISASGTFRDLNEMFRRLNSADRLIGVIDFNLAGSGGEADPILDCTMNLSVYFSK